MRFFKRKPKTAAQQIIENELKGAKSWLQDLERRISEKEKKLEVTKKYVADMKKLRAELVLAKHKEGLSKATIEVIDAELKHIDFTLLCPERELNQKRKDSLVTELANLRAKVNDCRAKIAALEKDLESF